MNLTRLAYTLAAAVVLGLTVGCAPPTAPGDAPGEVAKKGQIWHHSTKQWQYWLTIRDDAGKNDKGMVSIQTYLDCEVGDRWPDCKED